MEQLNIKTIKASRCLSSYFLDAWGIDEETELETQCVSSRSLLTAGRFDLACKLYYIECLDQGREMAFAEDLYCEHIRAFSGGTFIEPGLKTKNSASDYLKGFRALIDSIRTRGFDPSLSLVPVGEDGVILDGAHRVAIAIYYRLPLYVVKVPGVTTRYDYRYFRENGLGEAHLDFLACQFLRYTEQVNAVCLWPAAADEKKRGLADSVIREQAQVIYEKTVSLTYHGVEQLMIGFYGGMEWTGSPENGYSGVASKAVGCYRSGSPVHLCIITGLPLDSVLALKQRIRDIYAMGNDSIHITDTHEEAVAAGQMLLNRNSVDFLNYAHPYAQPGIVSSLNAETPFYRRANETMRLFGILPEGTGAAEAALPPENPEDYFWFRGIAYPSLSCVSREKRRSGGEADQADSEAVEALRRRISRSEGRDRERFRVTAAKAKLSVQKFAGGLRYEAVRTARVAYHRLKNHGQAPDQGNVEISDLRTVFLDINTTTAEYVVLRNWEGFYDDILLEGHNDIDLLCRDRDSRDLFIRMLHARPLTPDGFHYEFLYHGKLVTLDTRIVGDGYYDRRWQKTMLKTKRLHPLGFYIMDAENYYYSLIYHAIYQKKTGLSDEYAARLNEMNGREKALTQEMFARELGNYMKQRGYVCTHTADESVVRNFSVTSVEKTVRTPASVRLIHLYGTLKQKQYWQRLKIKLRKIIIRG